MRARMRAWRVSKHGQTDTRMRACRRRLKAPHGQCLQAVQGPCTGVCVCCAEKEQSSCHKRTACLPSCRLIPYKQCKFETNRRQTERCMSNQSRTSMQANRQGRSAGKKSRAMPTRSTFGSPTDGHPPGLLVESLEESLPRDLLQHVCWM